MKRRAFFVWVWMVIERLHIFVRRYMWLCVVASERRCTTYALSGSQ